MPRATPYAGISITCLLRTPILALECPVVQSNNNSHHTLGRSISQYLKYHRFPSVDADCVGNPASFLIASRLVLTSSAIFKDSATEACLARSFSASAWTVHTITVC
jgi:hypothetical protein